MSERYTSRAEDGFTLLEMVCVLAIVALVAAVLLPRVSQGTSRLRLEAYAVETAAMLKADRIAAIKAHREIAATVDAASRAVRSGAGGQIVRMPKDILFEALLPERCNEHPAFSTISFFANGRSCGGILVLSRGGFGYEVRVNWFTGGIEVVPRSAS